MVMTKMKARETVSDQQSPTGSWICVLVAASSLHPGSMYFLCVRKSVFLCTPSHCLQVLSADRTAPEPA